jgi:hypothetical protein
MGKLRRVSLRLPQPAEQWHADGSPSNAGCTPPAAVCQEHDTVPVLGHAFVGLTTAVYTRPVVRRRAGAALWTPLLVGLAYLPDIVSQLCDLAGLGRFRTATHSLLFAAAASILLAGPVAGLAGVRLVVALGLVLFSILTHDGLDLFQDPGGYPFWPFSSRCIDLSDHPFGTGLRQEVLWIGGTCAALILACMLVRLVLRGRGGAARPPGGAGQGTATPTSANRRGLVWFGYALTAVILVLAAGTHYLCNLRARQLAAAKALVRKGRAAEAFALLDEAEHWPHAGCLGYVDFARADAYRVMGDKLRAEHYYLSSLRKCPDQYWALAELAMLYTTFPEPLEQRRRRVEPVLERLRSGYSGRRDLPGLIARIEQKLRPAASRRARREKPPAPGRRKPSA